MYTHREDENQLQVSNFILKVAWTSLIFGKFTIRIPEIDDLLQLKSHFFAQFKRRFLVHIISAYPPSLTQKSEFYMIFFIQRFISSC